MAKKKQPWHQGSIFYVIQQDGNAVVGQVLELLMANVVSCAFFDIRIDPKQGDVKCPTLSTNNIISAVSTTKEQLDYFKWKVIGELPIALEFSKYPNAQYRSNGFIGTKIFDAAIVEDFLNAYYRLLPWDDWHDPNYLDKLLFSLEKKPKNLLYKNK